MTANGAEIGTIVLRVQEAFLERPDLTLTLSEAEERFGVGAMLCEAVLAALVDAGVLTQTADGAYERLFPRRQGHAA